MRYALSLARTSRLEGDDARQSSPGSGSPTGPVSAPRSIWILGGKARALTEGRYHVSFEDIRALAHPVLRHRVLLNFHAESEGVTTDQIIDQLLEARAGADVQDVAVRAHDYDLDPLARRALHRSEGAGSHRQPRAGRAVGRRGLHQRAAQGAVSRRVDRFRRAPRLHARRRHPAYRLATVRADGPVLRQAVRGGHQHELLGALRRVEVDELRQPGRHQAGLRTLSRGLSLLPQHQAAGSGRDRDVRRRYRRARAPLGEASST